MAANLDERTEPATPRRRQESRDKGQVARSQDLSAAVLLLAGMLALKAIGPWMWEGLLAFTTSALSPEAPTALGEVVTFSFLIVEEAIKRVAPIVITIFIAVVISLYAQVGNLVTLQPLIPSLSKINPLSGIARLFSIRSVMTAVINVFKLLLVGFVAYLTMRSRSSAVIHAFAVSFYDGFSLGTSLVFDLGIRLAVVLVILALLDFAWQKYRHERDMRMTKEEVKDELRSMEGDPQIKRRRRQAQLQMAMGRLRNDVPTADVVVTNPTHVAIAIRYDADSMIAPQVVAKGADYLALRIREIAKQCGIPIVERRPLARSLYESVEVGQYIPERFYRAIAEILAYIYELSGKAPARTDAKLAPA